MEREKMHRDILIIGAGPAGLSAAIRLKQLDPSLSVCVLEKGAQVGAHILSGAVLEPRALDELIPAWSQQNLPFLQPVTSDSFWFLTEKKHWTLPTPSTMKNHGNYIIRLGQLCRWLAHQAESLGVEIYPGFAAAQVLFDEKDRVCGISTGDMGIDRTGNPTSNYQPGMDLLAKQTLFAEGCRGSLTEILIKKYGLRSNAQPQTYAIGVKEIWEVVSPEYGPGKVIHTVGWPLESQTYGGSFIYHLQNNLVAIGFVVGLDYQNPYLNPFSEMQRFKTHPAIRHLLLGGKRLEYGARALNEGGFQSIPRLVFPGGALIGDCAGFLNVAKIKGTHTAMKSGMLAAEALCIAWKAKAGELQGMTLDGYEAQLRQSWIWQELWQSRNIRPYFKRGLWTGLVCAAVDTYVFRGRVPWTLSHRVDHASLKRADAAKPIHYPEPDGTISFDRLSSVYLSNTYHAENQPCHLKLRDPDVPIRVNLAEYDAPEQRYCPAGVYEIVQIGGVLPRLQINAQNCVHCKTCDIKDPTQNIQWVAPQGGDGPNYIEM